MLGAFWIILGAFWKHFGSFSGVWRHTCKNLRKRRETSASWNPSWRQDRPSWSQDGAKMPNLAPRWAQDGHLRIQNGHLRAQDGLLKTILGGSLPNFCDLGREKPDSKKPLKTICFSWFFAIWPFAPQIGKIGQDASQNGLKLAVLSSKIAILDS